MLVIRDSHLISAHSANKELKAEFWQCCHTDENSDRAEATIRRV